MQATVQNGQVASLCRFVDHVSRGQPEPARSGTESATSVDVPRVLPAYQIVELAVPKGRAGHDGRSRGPAPGNARPSVAEPMAEKGFRSCWSRVRSTRSTVRIEDRSCFCHGFECSHHGTTERQQLRTGQKFRTDARNALHRDLCRPANHVVGTPARCGNDARCPWSTTELEDRLQENVRHFRKSSLSGSLRSLCDELPEAINPAQPRSLLKMIDRGGMSDGRFDEREKRVRKRIRLAIDSLAAQDVPATGRSG